MPVNETDVQQVALLARLQIDDASLGDVTDRFGRILNMVDDLNTVNTDGVVPMSNPHDAVQRLREDSVSEHLDRDALLANAPEAEDGYFQVPRVID